MDILPALQLGSLVVVYAGHAASDEITHVAAKLALRGPVTVLDGGNRFQAYRIAHLLRKETTDVSTAANRLFIRRAFTCYQMLALLENAPALRQPYLVLDLLNSFYDDQVQSQEVDRLLETCMRQINRLRQFAPVAVTLGHPLLEERAYLIEKVCEGADTVFTEETILQEAQLSLF
jgi:hypothetical protein